MKFLYTKMKIFHFKEKLDSLPLEMKEILPPIQIRIKPTNVCAHNCWYCAYRVDNLQLGKDMNRRDYIPEGKMMEIIDDIIDMGVKAVTFSGGGDPFCYPYLLDAAKKLSRSPVKFAALTNGSRLKGEIAEVFSYYATWVRISIDGWDDKSYSMYRGVRGGEFTQVINNMENFKKLGGPCYLGVCIIVDQKNAFHIYDLIKRLKSVGVDSVKIAPCIVSNDGSENNRYHQPIFNIVKDQISHAKEDMGGDDFEIFDSYHTQLETFRKEYTWCPYLQICPVIGADLNLYSCQDKAYNLDRGLLGSLNERRLKELWFFSKERFFRIDPSRVCNHHCVHNANNKSVIEYLHTHAGHVEFV